MTDDTLELVKLINDSLDKFSKKLDGIDRENRASHESILNEQRKTNGTVKSHHETLFSPDVPEDGIVQRFCKTEQRITKLEKTLFRIIVIAPPIVFLCGLLGGQWLEEVLRDTPMALNGIMQWLGNLFG